MSASRIIEAIDVFEDRHLSVAACRPGPVPQKLSLDRLEEGFDGSVVAKKFPVPLTDTLKPRRRRIFW